VTIQTESVGTRLTVTAGPHTFGGTLQEALAPNTCEVFKAMLPFHSRIIHSRWSGEAAWIPLGDLDVGVGHENPTTFPVPGHILLHPAGLSGCEILFPYGSSRFYSKVGELAGNHFLTLTEGLEHLRDLGELVLWEGAKDIVFDLAGRP
jgi:hypothetical protein